MQWLRSFAALALLCGVVMTLLPEGGLRKTAALVMGLTLTLSWVDSLRELPLLPERFTRPDTVLTEAKAFADTKDYARQLSEALSRACGASVQVELDEGGRVSRIILPEDCDEAARRLCCSALGVSTELIATKGSGR